jgi:internalin A
MAALPTDDRATDLKGPGPHLPSRLPGILIALALLVGFLLVGWAWRSGTSHIRADLKLRGLGAKVDWDGENGAWRSGGVTSVDCHGLGDGIKDADLELIAQLNNVESLDLSGCQGITDEGLKILGGLTSLKRLDLGGPDRSDTVAAPRITDAGLKHLEPLTRLTLLSLAGTRVTDAGLVHLKGMKELEILDLGGTKITDAGLDHLRGLSQLKTLTLQRTAVTHEAIDKLQRAWPALSIIHDFEPEPTLSQGLDE